MAQFSKEIKMENVTEIELANKLFLKGNILKACETLENFLEINPESDIARKELGKFLGFSNQINSKNNILSKKFTVIPTQLRDNLWEMFVQEKFSELLELLEHLISVCDDDYEFFYLAAASCRKLEKYREGMEFIKKALEIEPKNYGANLEAGKLFQGANLYDLSMNTFEFCIELIPDKSDAYFALSSLLKLTKRYDEAIKLLENIKDDEENHFKVMEKIGECYFESAQYESSNEVYEGMLNKRKDGHDLWKKLIHSNLINTYMELDLIEKAKASMQHVQRLVIDNIEDKKLIANPRYNLAHAYLKIGQFNDAWSEYIHRFDREDFPSPRRKFNVPRARSLGELKGKRVLIWREQGVGDELMWYCLVPALIEKVNAEFVIECEKRLVDCVTRSFSKLAVREENFDKETLYPKSEDYDLHLPLSDLMVLFELNLEKGDLFRSWFVPDVEKVSFWNSALDVDVLNIAFSMRGHLQEPRRQVNYLDVSLLNRLIEDSPHNWICLDYTIEDERLEKLSDKALQKVVVPNVDIKNDFNSIGSLLSCCDLLISPITAIRSLASSVGTRNLSFIKGSRNPYNLGLDSEVFCEFKPIMFPNGHCVRLPHKISPEYKEEFLLNFFNKHIAGFPFK